MIKMFRVGTPLSFFLNHFFFSEIEEMDKKLIMMYVDNYFLCMTPVYKRMFIYLSQKL